MTVSRSSQQAMVPASQYDDQYTSRPEVVRSAATGLGLHDQLPSNSPNEGPAPSHYISHDAREPIMTDYVHQPMDLPTLRYPQGSNVSYDQQPYHVRDADSVTPQGGTLPQRGLPRPAQPVRRSNRGVTLIDPGVVPSSNADQQVRRVSRQPRRSSTQASVSTPPQPVLGPSGQSSTTGQPSRVARAPR